MKKDTIYAYSYAAEKLIIPREEILRYMGCKDEPKDIKELIDTCIPKVKKAINPKGSFALFELKTDKDCITLGGLTIKSKSLKKSLKLCPDALVFALTLGTDIDRLINKYQNISVSESLCINAIATAAIESLTDVFCDEICQEFKQKNLYGRPRFSAGYGDFSLSYQRDILNLINAPRLCGITLTDSLMMVPVKSVSAVMGISNVKTDCHRLGCAMCNQKNCNYRR